MRALVAEELEPFLRRTELPAGLDVLLLPRAEPVPFTRCDGLLPLITRTIGGPDMDRLGGLRVVANYGAGYDNIDVAAARTRGIAVSNTPDVLTGATAELTWALILATVRRLPEAEALARSGDWQGWEPLQLLGVGLSGKRLGIVGAGRIGREVGRRAAAFGMTVVYWSRHAHAAWEAEIDARRLELDELLASSDVVSIHVALTPQTTRLIDGAALRRMKPTAVLVNTARGDVMDETALVAALRDGGLRAAGLDVYAEEPHIGAELRALRNVVLLPHVASATEEARRAMWELAWDNLLRGLRGERLRTSV
jgi:glyoxylate reductase